LTDIAPAPGRFLIALPTLRDPNFVRSVVLLCEHNDEGSIGLIVNRSTSVKLAAGIPGPVAEAREGEVLFHGGPVSPSHIFALHNVPRLMPESREVVPGVWFTPGTQGVADRLRVPPPPGESLRLYAGYAGWGAGQLESEMEQTAWIVGPASADLVYAADPRTIWARALQAIGGAAAFLTTAPEDPRMN
jgi:putative transcriptional regulator